MNRIPALLLLVSVMICHTASAGGKWKLLRSSGAVPATLTLARDAAHPIFSTDEASLKTWLADLPQDAAGAQIMTLPMPDGTQKEFSIWQTNVLPATLAARHPDIRTFSATAVGQPWVTAKLDYTPYGFHAMVLEGAQTYFIDRLPDSGQYVLHYKRDERRPASGGMACVVPGYTTTDVNLLEKARNTNRTVNGYQLRTYRLALSCDHQYARAVTGLTNPPKEQVLSKMVTTLNRINGVYERELSVSFTLVAQEDTLIFTDSLADPFSLHDQIPSLLIADNQTVCDNRIGNANYDIGHIFSTGGGGLSQLACVCQGGLKAQSVTGSANPTCDGFDIDYVAHEIGHEVGSNHTFNNNLDGSCLTNAVQECAFQPGSGSTIMDYAGICGPDDLQPHSDAYFSGSSLLQIYQCISTTGDGCAVKTNTGNKPVNLPPYTASYSIPFLTPFELTALAAADSVADTSTTYCWEQWNLGDFGLSFPHTFYNGPIFRSYPPDTLPARIFPRLALVLADSLSDAGIENAEGEKAPDVARFLTFRLAVRNIYRGNGSFLLPDDSIHIDAINTGSGFRVTSHGAAGQAVVGTGHETVRWDVVQTNLPPISTDSVDISLSADGGHSWTYYLGRFANTGTADVAIPNISAKNARIKVKAVGNVFFSINRADINIVYYPGHTGDVVIFPVPAHDVLHLFTGVSGTMQAEIYTMAGKSMWSGTITDILTLNVTELPRGLYFIRMKGDSGELVRKFQVE